MLLGPQLVSRLLPHVLQVSSHPSMNFDRTYVDKKKKKVKPKNTTSVKH